MKLVFKQLVGHQDLFFNFLPQDWQNEIVPHWKNFKETSKIYIITENNIILGGGIVFSTCPPDVFYFKKEAEQWFENGYLYIGFLYISEDRRGQNLGSFWLDRLKKNNPVQKYWLLIEDERLHRFYQKNNFTFVKTICYNKHPECLYSFNPTSY